MVNGFSAADGSSVKEGNNAAFVPQLPDLHCYGKFLYNKTN
jgi:hypothetical protein